MAAASIVDNLFHDRLRASSQRFLWVGLAMLAIGIAAIVFPMISTLVATLLVGWVFLISGVFMAMGTFSIHGTGPFFGALLFSLLSIASGVFLLFSPLAGAAALTLLLSGILIVQGAFEISFAFEMRPHQGWAVMIISGIISVLMSILIVASWPAISIVLLGFLLGVNFISSGIGFVFTSRALKPAA